MCINRKIEQSWEVEEAKFKPYRHIKDFVSCKQNYRIWQGETWLRKQYILPSFKIKSGSKCVIKIDGCKLQNTKRTYKMTV